MSEPADRGTGTARAAEQRVPLWVVGLAIATWGWSADVFALAFPLLVLAMSPLVLRRRFDFSAVDFHRAFDVCWALFLGGILLVYSREAIGGVLRNFTRWLPAVVFPAVMAQAWSMRGRLPVSALVPMPGWRREVDPRADFDVSPIYVVVCLLAGSTVRGDRSGFYVAVLAVAGLGLWSVRRRGGRPGWAVGVLAVAAVAGWFVAGGIAEVQGWVEARMMSLATRWRGDERSDRVARTSIGQTGEVGGSSRVVLRVHRVGQAPPPHRLRVASFYSWREGAWFAPHGEPIKVEEVGDEWRLDPRPGREGAVTVEWVPSLTSRFLPLPSGTRVVADFAANRVERSPIGSVRAEVNAGMVSYRAEYGPDSNWEAEPMLEDRQGVPPAEVPAIQAVVEELGLVGQEPGEILRRIDEFFARKFKYTTQLEDVPFADVRALTPIGRFLLGNRAGHCEYFASAAVLLLRRVGIPARYATGYLVAAGEVEGDLVTVRERQAHAWVRVWREGRWVDFDPTPGDVLAMRAAVGGWGGRLERVWDNATFALAHWWWLGEKRLLRHAYWLVVPLLIGLLWRLSRVREARGTKTAAAVPVVVPNWPGLDSEWFSVLEFLEPRGWARQPGERQDIWWRRLGRDGWPAPLIRNAAQAQRFHERLRFDPRGLGEDERDHLRIAARDVLEWGLRRPPGKPSEGGGA